MSNFILFRSDHTNLNKPYWRITLCHPYNLAGNKDTFEMLENLNKLELTNKDIELIESALSTQKKILSVQSEAGGTGARQKLHELKHLMKRIGRSRSERKPPAGMSFLQMARNMFCADNRCGQTR